MMPWTSSDIFYYMGVGELDGVYAQNPYYTTVKDYYEENIENINDEILEKGAENGWSDTTVVYGPVAQLIFKLCSSISFKNIDFCLFVYKLVNLILLIASTYLIYKITNKKRFSLIFGLSPFIVKKEKYFIKCNIFSNCHWNQVFYGIITTCYCNILFQKRKKFRKKVCKMYTIWVIIYINFSNGIYNIF